MMWQIQYFLEWGFAVMQVLLQSEANVNLIFAALCIWAATGRGDRWCAGATALLHLLLILI